MLYRVKTKPGKDNIDNILIMSLTKCVTLEEEMRKNPQLKLSDIQILREWCEKQPHLPKIQDVQLAIFLHSNYYRLEPTKNTIENYFTIRTHVPEFFSNRDPIGVKELRQNFNILTHMVLKQKTKEGYDMLYTRLSNFDTSLYVFNDAMKSMFMSHDQFVWTRGSATGMIAIGDATGVSLGHVGRVSPAGMKKLVYYFQDAIPMRPLAIHVIHTSPIVDIFFKMAKPFLKEELVNMFHFHTSLESAEKYFPIDALPNESGGKAGSIQELFDERLKDIENFREWYLEDERINRVNESLRIGKSKTSNDLFGIEGSFKKLDID